MAHETSTKVGDGDGNGEGDGIELDIAALYLPVHCLCVQLSDCFVEQMAIVTSEKNISTEITSIKQRWEVFYRRLLVSRPVRPIWGLPEPHGYFGGRRCRNLSWGPGEDLEESELFQQNPVQIADLTSSILQNLQPIFLNTSIQDTNLQIVHQEAVTDLNTTALAVVPATLPERLSNFPNAPLDGNYLHSPAWWLAAFLDPATFPFIPALDTSFVYDKQQQKPDGGDWNWEFICRQLSQTSVYVSCVMGSG
ncbi:hypothetical protein G7Y89_g15245 [Cudoniella acicularis]|uniref:Uncharacterized protein n=1 Tax=Cudoniella acicularis TaxID=354080 RepID=A0A8H4QRH7_9HELO|nr:hypothetical protein G7Y89_g15245 [Cudoniella acicularis]